MAGIITLEDGSELYASSLGLSGALELVAGTIPDLDTRLARWLNDVAQRSAPYMDLDIRGLSYESRCAFWVGVDRAHDNHKGWDQEASFSPAVDVIRSFYERRDVRRAICNEQIPQIDLNEIWFDTESP